MNPGGLVQESDGQSEPFSLPVRYGDFPGSRELSVVLNSSRGFQEEARNLTFPYLVLSITTNELQPLRRVSIPWLEQVQKGTFELGDGKTTKELGLCWPLRCQQQKEYLRR
jgi:hypothetical protein